MSIPLDHDIYNENISTKLLRTPFDFIMGYPTNNKGHLNYRDPEVYNITQLPSYCVAQDSFTYYDPAQQMNCGIERGVLNMEIGDEELYLENWNLNRNAEFQAEYAVYVNKRNPYYEYPSTPVTSNLTLHGMYSKDTPFHITPQGHATFISNGADSPTGLGFIYNTPQSSAYWDSFEDSIMLVCFEGPSGMITDSTIFYNNRKEGFIKLNPNPSYGTKINVHYHFKDDNLENIQIYDLTGKLVYSNSHINNDKKVLIIHLENLTNGIYIAKFIGKKSSRTKKIIIK